MTTRVSGETARVVNIDPAELVALRDKDAQTEKAAPTPADDANFGRKTESVEQGNS